MVINGSAPKFWGILCEKMGRPELVNDPLYATNPLRVKNRESLDKIVEAWTTTKTTSEIMEELLPSGFACAPIYSLDQVVADEQFSVYRNMFPEIEDEESGTMRFTNSAVKRSETMPEIKRPAPHLGEHNDEVYSEVFGFSAEQIQELKDQEII